MQAGDTLRSLAEHYYHHSKLGWKIWVANRNRVRQNGIKVGMKLIIPDRHVHHVQPNDTLWSLAERYYDDSKHWEKILKANRCRVTDQRELEVGMTLVIP